MKVSHYYAGYRIDDKACYTENRIVEPGCRQLSTSEFVHEFWGMLEKHGLTQIYIDEFQNDLPGCLLGEWWRDHDPQYWITHPFVWPDDYLEEFAKFNTNWCAFVDARL